MQKVTQFYNKNQFIIEGDEGTTFQSYESTIATIDKQGNLTLFTDWDYSNTIRKYLYLFLSDYRYEMNQETRDNLWELTDQSNKRAFIQNLIDTKKIVYKEI